LASARLLFWTFAHLTAVKERQLFMTAEPLEFLEQPPPRLGVEPSAVVSLSIWRAIIHASATINRQALSSSLYSLKTGTVGETN
jgi:hypothetical protein